MGNIRKAVLAMAVLGIFASSAMAFTMPAYAIAKYRTWLTNSYTFMAQQKPYYRSYGNVTSMPTFMLESLRTQTTSLTDTIMFAGPVACPFITASAATMTATVQVFRDYDNGTPLPMRTPSVTVDSMWFEFPPYAQGFIITYAAADTPAYFILGGYAIPNPR